ncbi:hypothetical protein THUN1379_20530 [Paludibacterium sp. THUN1379]|nr:hypothetical protein THUN1379_20530 [Paludibacterium sp. THUN1379]
MLALSLQALPAAAGPTLVFYSEEGQKPMSYQENGMPKGEYIDHFLRIARQVPGYQIEIHFASWARGLEETREGLSAGLIGAYYRPQERPYLNHSKAIYQEDVAVHCNRDAVADRQFRRYPDDFAGLTFGNQRGYLAPGPQFFAMAAQGRIKVVEGLAFTGLVKKMLVGEIDCVVNPSLVLDQAITTLEAQGLPERMRYKSRRIMLVKTESVHVGFSKKYEASHPELKTFRALFDQIASRYPVARMTP